MKNLLLVFIFISITQGIYSQSKKPSGSTVYSVGIEAAIPMGIFNDIGYSFGIGGSAQGEYRPSQSLGLTVNAGIVSYSGKSDTKTGNYTILPLLAGAKYYITESLYGHAEFGAGIGISQDAGTRFAFSTSLGYLFLKRIDAEAKFMGLSNSAGSLNSLGLRIAYNL